MVRTGLPAEVGTIQEKKPHLDKKEMNEHEYVRVKKNKGGCGNQESKEERFSESL